jgi:hypothetical protein
MSHIDHCRNLPAWVLDLVAELEQHEEEHPAQETHPAARCVWEILSKVPGEVRAYAAGRAAGLRRRELRPEGGPQ